MENTTCGNFSPDGKEFILVRPLLAHPWMNVLTNGNWAFVASHLGGGYSFLGNPTIGRITRWHIDGVPRDTTGKFVYLRDEDSGEWWNANGYPPTRQLDSWRCHIGLGYNRIVSEHRGIECEILYFCPMPDAELSGSSDVGDPCLIWWVRIKNRSGKWRAISATNYVELALGNWFEDTSWREFYLLFNRQKFESGILYTRSTLWIKNTGGRQAGNAEANNIPFERAVFLASSAPVVGYEGDRCEFIGSYRNLENPIAMQSERLRNGVNLGRDACEILQHRFELDPDETTEYILLLGAIPQDSSDAGDLTAKYLSPWQAGVAFENLQAYWSRVVSSPSIETPDHDLDVLVNSWFKYQAINLAWWDRSTGYFNSDIYNFGVRDACLDAVCRLPQEPEWVRESLVKRIMIWQFEEGDYAQGGNFFGGSGIRTSHSDGPINTALILSRYVRETGDFSVLEEVTPYAHRDGKKSDTIYQHVINGLEFFFNQFSKRKLPLILQADWNDALDQMGNQGKGDSVMLACWAIYCIRQFFPCMEFMKDLDRLKRYRRKLDTLADTINRLAWDGDWYHRAMHDSGWILGSKNNQYGKIWTNPNVFAIVSGVANEGRTERIFRSFEKYLDHEFGSYIFHPPFAEPDERAGTISRLAPGAKENGSIFGPSSRWRIWAECFGGRGDKAYEILHKMSPITRHEADPDLYRVEPYVACQFIYGPESSRSGEGSHSWATETAAWTLVAVWEWILGVRPELDGLLIDPCLPSAWTGAKINRRYRGASYEIEIEKPLGICKGEVTLYLDGDKLSTNFIPPRNDGRLHRVKAVISTGSTQS